MKLKLFSDRFLLLAIWITALAAHFLEKELGALLLVLVIFTLNWEGWMCSWRESEALKAILEKYGVW